MKLFLLSTGAVTLGVVFWLSFDIVLVVRGSEEVLGKLRDFGVNWRETEVSDLQRLRCLKTAKACRPLRVPVGIFGELSFDIPVIMWDEILNQLLFLLSF